MTERTPANHGAPDPGGGVLPARVGVYGGGRMGSGIAHAFLIAGSTVVVIESDPGAVTAARGRVRGSLELGAAKAAAAAGAGVATASPDPSPADVLDRLTTTSDPAALSDCTLVIEAVPENAVLKAHVFAVIAARAPDAVLATNTSSLSVDALAATLDDPTRFLGLHFFNPVPVSELVEVVVGTRTAPALVARAQGWVRGLGKTAITVADSPGFASSRLGVCLALEAMRMLEDGVASAADLDTALTLGYRHPVGPLRTTDLVGLDVRLAIADHLARELGPRFEAPRVLRDLVAAGHLGRKVGRGFYQW